MNSDISGNGKQPELVPIREVARQTGINPVTLRAWERRYGLIKPLRTAKGHRLYTSEHIAQINEVRTWLQRGVSVGQVKRLLIEHIPVPLPASSQWTERLQQWLGWIEQLAERQLDEGLHEMLALYPLEIACQNLLLPLVEHLELRRSCQPRARVQQVFLLSWLRSRLGARVAHGNRLSRGAPVLISNTSDRAVEPGLWLLAWLLSDSDCPLRILEWSVSAEDLQQAIELSMPRAVLLFANRSVDPEYLRGLLQVTELPQLLCGHAVTIHHESLLDFPELHRADNPLAALHSLRQLGLLTSG